jgi:hypothetical protein
MLTIIVVKLAVIGIIVVVGAIVRGARAQAQLAREQRERIIKASERATSQTL